MNRKILSTAILLLVTAIATPLAQARDDRDGWNGRDNYRPAPVYREKYVERHYYHPGQHRGWYKSRHHHHHYRPAPRHYHYYHDSYPAHRAHSSAPHHYR